MIVPFDAGYLARFATNARRHIDVLADFLFTTCARTRHGTGMGRDFLNLKCLWITHCLSPASRAQFFFFHSLGFRFTSPPARGPRPSISARVLDFAATRPRVT